MQAVRSAFGMMPNQDRGTYHKNPELELNKIDRFVLVKGAIGRIGTPVDVLVYTPSEFASESVREGSFVKEVIDTGRFVYGSA